VGSISAAEYALDAYREMPNEIFIAAKCFKSFSFYGLTWYNNWIAGNGAQQVFFVVGVTSAFWWEDFEILLIYCLLAGPAYISGEKLKCLCARYVLPIHCNDHSRISSIFFISRVKTS
jgi:hypothetical protein